MTLVLESLAFCSCALIAAVIKIINSSAVAPRMLTYRKKAGYTTSPVSRGWAGVVLEKTTSAFGQEQ